MNADQWARVKLLFHAALSRAPNERATFLSTAYREGPDADGVRAEVERLLAAHHSAGEFIEEAALGRSTSPFPSPLTGRVIGRYEVGRLIGVGGMGEVYAARDLDLRRDVAIKMGTATDADAHARLKREAQHASQLNHPHICTIHEVGIVDGQPFIVMEFVKGERLSDLTSPDGLRVEDTVRYGKQIADALAHAHEHGVIHRDLKSANVVITPEGRAKILDFGLARRLSSQSLKDLSESRKSITGEGVVSGTLSCIAPEVLRGEQPDERSDIWSLGILLYEMVAGRRPFEGATGFEVSAAILHDPPPPLPERIPEPLQAIITRCLAKNPRERYADAGKVRSALEAAPASTASASFPSRFWRYRLAWMLAAVVGLGTSYSYYLLRSNDVPVAIGTSGRPAIAFMNFENVGAAPADDTRWMSSGVPSMLLTGLAQTRGLEIVSAQRLHDAVKQIGGSLESLDKSQAAEVARRAGAGAVVVGSIFKNGPEIRIDAQLEDLATGRVLVADSVRGTDLFALVDQLATSIRRRIVDASSGGHIRGIAEISSSSLEAYRLYSEAVHAQINTRWDDAQGLLERAVAIDPEFADAYLQLAFVNFFRQNPGLRQQYLREAAEHIDRLGERQRLLLEIEVARDAGKFVEAARSLDTLIATFPDVEDAYRIAFHLYDPVLGGVHDPQKLLTITAAGAARLPTSRNDYGYALLAAGRYPEALREFEAYARFARLEPNPHDSLGEAFLMMGMPEKAVESYSRALAVDPTFDGATNGRAWALAMAGRYDDAVLAEPEMPSVKALIFSRIGRYREAAQVVAMAKREAERTDHFAEHGSLFLLSSLLAIERKEYARAADDSNAANRIFSKLPEQRQRPYRVIADLMSGIAELRVGKMEAVRSHVESQRRIHRPELIPDKFWHQTLEGEVALASGDYVRAAASFSVGQPSRKMWFYILDSTVSVLANNLLFRDGLARVAKGRGDLRGAVEIYQRLLMFGPEAKFVAVFEPRYVLEIARLLDQSGEKREARNEYLRFLEFWKNADSDLPELAEAKRAVARLAGSR